MYTIEHATSPNLSDSDIDQLASLFCLSFADPTRNEPDFTETMRNVWKGYSGPPEYAGQRFMLRRDGQIVANANIFPRLIDTPRGKEFVAMVAAVMSHPLHRGLGYGKAVVEAAFSQVAIGRYSFAILQAGSVRGFYEKLGCQLISNPVVNSRNTAEPNSNPFWEPHVFIYPEQKGWKNGTIDLLGPAV